MSYDDRVRQLEEHVESLQRYISLTLEFERSKLKKQSSSLEYEYRIKTRSLEMEAQLQSIGAGCPNCATNFSAAREIVQSLMRSTS
jgi:hypothetical protein